METSSRPSIPSELRRRVLVEAGHRCAIPTCRYIEVDVHHITPWEKCKTHDYQNLIALCPNCHRRAHRDEIDKKSLKIYKSSLRFTHDKFSQFEVDVLFDSAKIQNGESLLFPPQLTMLIRRLLDAEYVLLQQHQNLFSSSGGMQTSPLFLSLTLKGRIYIESLGLDAAWPDDA